SQPDRPIAWAGVLDQVDETLRRTAAAAAEREQAISSLCPSSEALEEGMARWQQRLTSLERQMQGWPASLQQAEKESKEADEVLNAGEEALHRWLSAAQALERRLAKWVMPEV